MEAEIIEEKENPLFDRKEVKLSVNAQSNPSKDDARKLITEKFSSPEESIVIEKIDAKFGANTFTITAKIYSSKELKDKIEIKPKKKKQAS